MVIVSSRNNKLLRGSRVERRNILGIKNDRKLDSCVYIFSESSSMLLSSRWRNVTRMKPDTALMVYAFLLHLQCTTAFLSGEEPRSRRYGRTSAWRFLCNPVTKMITFRLFPSNGAPVQWNWQGKTELLGEKPVPVTLCPPHIPDGLTPYRTRASAVGGQRLAAWAMARPCRTVYFLTDQGPWWFWAVMGIEFSELSLLIPKHF
jgi:hypothetical protein